MGFEKLLSPRKDRKVTCSREKNVVWRLFPFDNGFLKLGDMSFFDGVRWIWRHHLGIPAPSWPLGCFICLGEGWRCDYHGANNSLGNLALKAYLDVPGTSRYHLQSFACGICWILGWYCSCIYQAVYSCFYLFIVFNLWTNRQQVSAIYCNQVMYQNRKKLITGWLIRQSTTSTFDGIFFLVSAKLPCHETRLSLAITLRVLRFAKWFGTMTHIFGPVYKCKYMRYMIYVHVFAIWVKYVGFKFHLATLSTLLTSGFIEVACNS